MINSRIEFLSQLLEKYDVKQISKMLRDNEVAHVKEVFKRVRYSENMQKRMIAEARRKGISKVRREYIQSLVDRNKTFKYEDYLVEITNQVYQFFDKHKALFQEQKSIGEIYFEHGFEPDSTRGYIYKKGDSSSHSTELLRLDTIFDFSAIWGFINERKFVNMAESLEIIDIENEEYPLIFEELFKLRGYTLVKMALHSETVSPLIKALPISTPFKVRIGEHDNLKYDILKLQI